MRRAISFDGLEPERAPSFAQADDWPRQRLQRDARERYTVLGIGGVDWGDKPAVAMHSWIDPHTGHRTDWMCSSCASSPTPRSTSRRRS